MIDKKDIGALEKRSLIGTAEVDNVVTKEEAAEFERRKKVFREYLNSEDYHIKAKLRAEINDACSHSAKARAMTWNLCARPDNPVEGCKFFIENFAYSFDPRPEHAPHHLPFIKFEYQDAAIAWLIDHIDNSKDGLIEKSRDMGVSWIVFVWVPLWMWLFRDGVNILVGSYKERLVDDRTKDSLFGMMDYGLAGLPKWILPKGFNENKHRTQMKLVNPANNNLISGETMTSEFGRGMRKTAILFDELGTWDYAKDGWESAGDSTSCRIANSTPKGMNFYAKLRRSGMDVLTLHWTQHPLKDKEWYEFEKIRRTEEEIAQELDISYNKSLEGRVYNEWNDENIKEDIWEYDPLLPLYVGWDFGYDDDTAIIWAQPCNGRLRIVDTYRNTNKLIDFFTPFITGILPSDGYSYSKSEIEMIREHKNWRRGTHFGDPAGRFRNQVVNKTVIDVLAESGIHMNFHDSWKEFSRRKTAAKLLIMSGIDLSEGDRIEYFAMCMNQASYPKVKNQGEEEVRSLKPKHDWTSHYRSAFEYLAQGIASYQKRIRTPYDKVKKNTRRGAIRY